MSGLKLPRLGIRLSGGIEARRCVELAQAAEAGGFDSVWFAENPLQRGVFATAGACAAATGRVRIGIGIVNPYTSHPVQIAMDFAALDELAEGRAVLGIGSGVAAAIRRMGLANDRPMTAVRDAIVIARALLAGDDVTYQGAVFRVDAVRLASRPARTDPPIYMAAVGERMLRACGAVADGFIVSNMTPPRSTARMAGIVAAAAEKSGRRRPVVVQYAPCAVRADSEAAREIVKAAIGEMLTSFWPASGDWSPARETIVAESGIGRADFTAALDRLRVGEPATAVLDERFVAAFAIAGTAEECRAQAAAYREAGVDELALTFAGAQPAKDIASFVRLCA